MGYRISVLMFLMLLVLYPMMSILAAPAPDPLGILEIGPPPEGWATEQYFEDQIRYMTSLDILRKVVSDPDVKKLSSVASIEDTRSWLAKHIRVTPEQEKRRFRFTFRAGKRNEQVIIINALLRVNLSVDSNFIKNHEEDLRRCESRIAKLKSRDLTDTVRKVIHDLRTNRIPVLRAEIARLKLTKVIKWAK